MIHLVAHAPGLRVFSNEACPLPPRFAHKSRRRHVVNFASVSLLSAFLRIARPACARPTRTTPACCARSHGLAACVEAAARLATRSRQQGALRSLQVCPGCTCTSHDRDAPAPTRGARSRSSPMYGLTWSWCAPTACLSEFAPTCSPAGVLRLQYEESTVGIGLVWLLYVPGVQRQASRPGRSPQLCQVRAPMSVCQIMADGAALCA